MKLRAALTSVLALAALTFALPLAAEARLATPDGSSSAGSVGPRTAAGLRTAITPNGSWPVYHHDDAHTGADLTLNAVSSVRPGWTSVALDGQVYASPLIYGGIVYVATLNNTVYALNQADGSIIWSNHLHTPESRPNGTPGGWVCGNATPQGILGTPVIDPSTNRIYAVTLSGTDDLYRLEGLNLATGVADIPTVITTKASTGFDWTIQQQRGALAMSNGYVYVPFGGRAGDCGSYHGWVFAVPENGTAVTHNYVTPGVGAGFWAAGGVVVDDSTGKVFVTSGNGTGSGCDANSNGTPVFENDAVVRLSSTLAHEDSFVPFDWKNNWCGNDQDLGSAAPLLISPNLMFQAGKWGTGFLINPANLGGMDGQLFPTPSPQTYVEADVCLGNVGSGADATFGSFAYAAPFVYVECDGRGLVALHVNIGTPSFSPCDATCAAPDWHAGSGITFGPPIVAGGAVWVASNNGLYAFAASNGALIYHSAPFGINRFVTPAEAGGQVFVPAGTVVKQFVMGFGVNQSGPAPAPPSRLTPIVQASAPAPPTRQPVVQSTPNIPPPR
jgi:outer membrane protein assembly factor BamB